MNDEKSKPVQQASQLPAATPVKLAEAVEYVPGGVVSRTLVKSNGGTITLFAFDAGQGLSEHSAPFDAFVQVLDGHAELTIGGQTVQAATGETVVMPANIPHAVQARQRFKMLLVMIRG